MSKTEVMFNLLADTFNETMKLLPQVKFDKNNRVHQGLMSLYASIIENTDSALVLRRAGKAAGVDNILRTNLEAFVDLINLANDDAYYDQMLALYHKDWLDLVERGLAGNPYLAFFKGDPEAAKRLKEHKDALKTLEKLGKPKTIFQRFEMAGMENEYRAAYKDLSGVGHNNIKALSERHFIYDEDGEIEVAVFAEMAEESLLASLDQFVTILAQAGHIIHDYFKSPGAAEVATFMQRRKDLQDFFESRDD